MPTGYNILRDQNITPEQWINYYSRLEQPPVEVAPIEFTYGTSPIGSPYGANSQPIPEDRPTMQTLADLLQLNNKPYTQGVPSSKIDWSFGGRGNGSQFNLPNYGVGEKWPYIDPMGTPR